MSVFAMGGRGFDLEGVNRAPLVEAVETARETLFDDRLGLGRGTPAERDRLVLAVETIRKPLQKSVFLRPVRGNRVVEKQIFGVASDGETGTQRVDFTGQQLSEFGGRRHGGALPET